MSAETEATALRLGARLAELEQAVARSVELRQGVVDAVDAGPPRTVDVDLDEGLVPAVALLEYHAAPVVGETVWIARVGAGRWLYHGRQG